MKKGTSSGVAGGGGQDVKRESGALTSLKRRRPRGDAYLVQGGKVVMSDGSGGLGLNRRRAPLLKKGPVGVNTFKR